MNTNRRLAKCLLVVGSALLAEAMLAEAMHQWILPSYLARRLSHTSTPAEELAVCVQINEWAQKGITPSYSITMYDNNGIEFVPATKDEFDKISGIVLNWHSDISDIISINHILISRDSLSVLMRE